MVSVAGCVWCIQAGFALHLIGGFVALGALYTFTAKRPMCPTCKRQVFPLMTARSITCCSKCGMRLPRSAYH